MDTGELFTIAVLALAVSAISVTTTRGGVFSKQRIWLLKHNNWLGRLFSCPYCLSHWVSAVLVAVYRPTPVHIWYPLDLIASIFMAVAMAAVVTGIVTKLIDFNEAEDEEVIALREALEDAKSYIKSMNGGKK